MLEKDKTVLVVVDVQGRLAEVVSESQGLFENIGRLLAGTKILGMPILCTEQIPDKLGATRPEISSHFEDSTAIVAKSSFSCCGESLFTDALARLQRNQVLICGIEAHVCVCQTALDLLERGYEVHVLADAVSSRSNQNKEIALNRLGQAGAVVSCVEMALFELLGHAEGKEFKQMLKIIK